MLRVVHGNRLDALAAALAEALPPPGDPFARTTIVVSSALVARWATYEIARARGIATAIDLPFLEAFVEETWTAGTPLRAMDKRKLAALVASVLADRAITDELEPVRAYLDDDDAAARQVRRVQLARQIAALVWEYALTRPEWLDAWEAGRELSSWQARIVHEVARRSSIGDARWTATPRLPRARRALGLASPVARAPVHVIGFSFLAPAYLDALAELGATSDVVVYAQDPCEELWDDVPGRARRAAVSPSPSEDPRALTLWGRPARDYVTRLVELSDGRIEDRFVDPGSATALAALRGDLITRRASGARVDRAGVTVLACPSITRELEVVGSEIRRLLDEDRALRANEIAVYAAGPDADRYLAQLPAVWRPLAIDHHVIDAPLAEHGRVAEAALLLLELPLGRFARPELLRLMTHPAVLARHRHVDPEDWIEWADRLGIVHGASAADHAHTYLAGQGELFHWDQGIVRLALGAFLDPPLGADGAPAPVRFAGHDYLPEPIAPDQQASAAAFSLLARSLLADSQWLIEQEAPLARWAEILGAMAASYLGARDELATRELGAVRAELAKLAELDLDGRALGYAEVVELARKMIGGLRGDRGLVLAHGVRVAPLAPGRALPSRHAFVLGLGEGLVPDTAPRSPLDLRADEIRRGDVSRGDRDRYAFLECVLAPDDDLYLSYVARDLETGDALAPSSLVVELAEMISFPLATLTVEHPLHRWDASYDDRAAHASRAPARARERNAALVRDRLTRALADRGVSVPEPAALADLLAGAPLPHLRGALRLGPAADLIARDRERLEDDAPITISLAALRRFLETPAQAWAQVVLRLADDDGDDLVERADEPFATDAHQRALFLRDVFARHLGASGTPPVPIDAALLAVARARALSGRAPVGVFGEVELARHGALLRRWSDEVAARAGAGAIWKRHGFGKSAGAGCDPHGAIAVEATIAGRTRRVELVGWTELVGGAIGSLILQPGNGGDRHTLRGAFDAAVLAATELAHAHAHLVLDCDGVYEAVTHRPWASSDARAWLRGLLEELLGTPHAYLLSLKQVAAIRKGNRPPADRANGHAPGAIGYGPLRHDDDLRVPDDAAAIVARRHGPIYDRMTEGSR